jgi:hypothetical protein
MRKPILLTQKELIEPITQALNRLEKIRQRKASNDDNIILEGLFVLAVSSFENCLNDTLKILLTHIPDKLDSKLENISKEDLIEGDPLQKAIQNKIHNISYKNLKEIIAYFIKTTAIDEDSISEVLFDKLQEIKASRNLLLHNNLIVNSIYKETAGKLIRSPRNHGLLEIDQDYLYNSIVTLRDILSIFQNQLIEKYKKYTRINAVKQLWEFMFTTPIMKFENEWRIDKKADCIHSYNQDKSRRGGLSGGEEIIFNIWLSHFEGNGLNTGYRNFHHLDNSNKKRLAYLLSVIDIIKPH